MHSQKKKSHHGSHKSKRKRENMDSATVEKSVKNLDKKRLLQYVKRHFHNLKKNHATTASSSTSKNKNLLPSLIFTKNKSAPYLNTSNTNNKNSRINILQDQFSNTVYHSKLLRQSQILKKIDLGKKELLLKRARLIGIGQLRHKKPFSAFGYPKMQKSPSLNSIEGLERFKTNTTNNNRHGSSSNHDNNNSNNDNDTYEAWYAKENKHLIKLARHPTKNKNRMQVDEFINFCRPYFERANIDIGPDEDDLMRIFQACKIKPAHDFVLKRHFIHILTSDHSKQRFSNICTVLTPLFQERRPDFTSRTTFDKDFPIAPLTKKSFTDAAVSMQSTINQINTNVKFINGLSMSESIRKQKLLSAMHELSLEIENLNSVGKLLD